MCELKGHKVILSQSGYFKQLFSEHPDCNTLDIWDVDYNTLSNIMKYLYGQNIRFNNASEVNKVLAVAKQFNLDGFVRKWEIHLNSSAGTHAVSLQELTYAIQQARSSFMRIM